MSINRLKFVKTFCKCQCVKEIIIQVIAEIFKYLRMKNNQNRCMKDAFNAISFVRLPSHVQFKFSTKLYQFIIFSN